MKHYVISGTSATGKSTLVDKLSANFNVYSEMIEGSNEIYKNYLLSTKKNDKAKLKFIKLNMIDKFKKTIKSSKTTIFDRNIFDYYVAGKLRVEPKSKSDFQLIDQTFRDCISSFVKYNIQIEYIILKTTFDEFKKRILKRGREDEVNNITNDDTWYRWYHSKYNKILVNQLKKYDIKYKIIDTSKFDEFETFKAVSELIV